MKVFALLLALVGAASAQVIGFGRCPEVRPVMSFDAERFVGTWFEIAKFYEAGQEDSRCNSVNYYPLYQDVLGFRIFARSGRDLMDTPIFEGAVSGPREGEGGLLRSVMYEGQTMEIVYKIVAMDYGKNYMIHTCKEYFFGWINVQFNWIASRNRTMPEEDLDNLYRMAAMQGINPRKFIETDQRGCDRMPEEPMRTRMPEDPMETRMPEDPMRTRMPEDPMRTRMPEDPMETRMPEDPMRTRMPEDPMETRTPEDPMETRMPEDPMGTRMPEEPVSRS